MKKLILLAALFSGSLFSQETSLEVITIELSKHHKGDEVMQVIQGRRNFVGYFQPVTQGLGGYDEASNVSIQDSITEVDDSYQKNPHLTEKQVQRAIRKLKRKCERSVKEIEAASRTLGERYYCSDVYVYTGDTKNPAIEGIKHTARGQLAPQYNSEFLARGTKSESKTRLSLPSNNEHFGDYEVYTIAIMRNWDQ